MIPKAHEKQEVEARFSQMKQAHFKYLHNLEVVKFVWPMYATRMGQDLHSPGLEPGHMRHVLQGELETQTFQAWLSMGCGPTSQGNEKGNPFILNVIMLNAKCLLLK